MVVLGAYSVRLLLLLNINYLRRMKKIYMIPQAEVSFAEVVSMLAESLPISNDTVNGDDALTKESNWDIWNEE